MGAGLSESRLPICVDFDGTICIPTIKWDGDYGKIEGYPVEGCFQRLHEYADWRPLVILSARAEKTEGWLAIDKWMWEEDSKYSKQTGANLLSFRITATKPPAAIYVDDKGFRFEGVWPTVEELERMEPWYLKTTSP